MEKFYYFLIYYSYSSTTNNNINGIGCIAYSTNIAFFSRKNIEQFIKSQESFIEKIVITGFNELTEEQYNIYINKQ